MHNIERVREGHKTVKLNTTQPTQINHTIFLFPVMHSVLQNENHLPSIINDSSCLFCFVFHSFSFGSNFISKNILELNYTYIFPDLLSDI